MSELELLGPPEPHEIGATRYPVETLRDEDDNGTMPENVDALREHVVGQRIISAKRVSINDLPQAVREELRYSDRLYTFQITLSNGKRVYLTDTDDCCAVTNLEAFLLRPDSVDHIITGIGTTDGYTRWHIYADLGDILALAVDWSPGNPFYYGYGFDIRVTDFIDADVVDQAALPSPSLELEA